MGKKMLIGTAMVAGAVLGVLAVGLVNNALAANVSLGTASSANSKVTHGDFLMLDDGGVHLDLCGRTSLVEDGGVVFIINGKSPCTGVDPGVNGAPFINFVNGAGLNQWKNDHGL